MGKLDGKVAVITGGTAGMALAGAKLFVDEGAHVFITGRRKDVLDEAVKQIGRNVTGVQGDAADLDDLDRLYDTVKRENVFIAGDNPEAKASVEAFIESLGLRPLDVGGLKMAHWLEGAGVVTVGLANHGVGNLDFALSITELPA